MRFSRVAAVLVAAGGRRPQFTTERLGRPYDTAAGFGWSGRSKTYKAKLQCPL